MNRSDTRPELTDELRSPLAAITDHIVRLISCESPSADLAAVSNCADELTRIGEDILGASPERIIVDGCTHLRWQFGDAARVLLLGHLDTVWPKGSLLEHPAHVAGNVLRGPGSFDMKTGVVMALHAVAAAKNRDGVRILITGDEEIGSNSSRALIERSAQGCEAVLVLEAAATGGALKVGRKGVSCYEVTVHGLAAHAGLEPEKGINAAVEMSEQILAVARLGCPELETTVVPTVARAGTTTNTVPGQARFAVDVRAWTKLEQNRVHKAISALRPIRGDARLTIEGGPNRPPFERTAADQLFARAQRLAHGLRIDQPLAAVVGGSSDGNFTANLGVPTLDGLGAVGGGAHAASEHVLLDALPDRIALVAALIDDILLESAPQ